MMSLKTHRITNLNFSCRNLILILSIVAVTYVNAQTAGAGVTDVDGNTYKTVIIGTQEWMAENLRVSHYLNGDLIPHISDSVTWDTLDSGTYVYYNNDSTNYSAIYGKLYNYYSANDNREVCPTGWRIPSLLARDTLANFLGSNSPGGRLKDTLYWDSPNLDATNELGFNGRPGGKRRGYNNPNSPAFEGLGNIGYYWIKGINKAMELSSDRAIFATRNTSYRDACNIRCMRDVSTSLEEQNNEVIFRLYPNPAVLELHVEFTEENFNSTTFQVRDINGRLVFSGNLKAKKTSINISRISPGTYCLNVGDNPLNSLIFIKE